MKVRGSIPREGLGSKPSMESRVKRRAPFVPQHRSSARNDALDALDVLGYVDCANEYGPAAFHSLKACG